MKEWNEPLIEELEIRTTAYQYAKGSDPDTYVHDNVTKTDVAWKYKKAGSGSTTE
jgi:hypothetical protein